MTERDADDELRVKVARRIPREPRSPGRVALTEQHRRRRRAVVLGALTLGLLLCALAVMLALRGSGGPVQPIAAKPAAHAKHMASPAPAGVAAQTTATAPGGAAAQAAPSASAGPGGAAAHATPTGSSAAGGGAAQASAMDRTTSTTRPVRPALTRPATRRPATGGTAATARPDASTRPLRTTPATGGTAAAAPHSGTGGAAASPGCDFPPC